MRYDYRTQNTFKSVLQYEDVLVLFRQKVFSGQDSSHFTIPKCLTVTNQNLEKKIASPISDVLHSRKYVKMIKRKHWPDCNS